jgi:type I restriction enzyme, S subunit
MTDLPSTWTKIPLAKVGRWIGGGTPSKANPRFWANGTIPWVSPKDMKVDVVSDAQDHITEEAVAQSATNLVEPGSVLLVVRSGILQHTLPVAVTLRRVALNQDLKAVQPNENVRSNYLALVLRAFEREILHKCSKTGTTVQSLNVPALIAFEIPLPPRNEQDCIVAEIEKQFTRLDAAVASLKRARANLKLHRAAVLNSACEGAKAGAIRDGWPVTTLASLCEIFVDCAHRTPKYTAFGPYALGPRDVVNGALNLAEARHVSEAEFEIQARRRIPQAGDIVYSRELSLGWAVEIPEGVRVCLSQGMCLFRPSASVLTSYLLAVLNGPVGRRQAFAAATGSAHPHINLRDIRAYQIPLPPLAEQHCIVTEVEHRLSVIEEVERFVNANLRRAARLRQSILQHAFSGRLVKSNVTEKSAAKTKERSFASRRHFLRALLSAEIVHQLHAEPTFGQVKHQKIFHLCEHIAEVKDLDVQYHRDAAGPYDNRLIYANEAELKRQKWYESYPRKNVGHGYRPLAKAGGHEKYLERYWPDKLETIRRLIQLMRHWDTEGCEIFSTAYAAWNDLLLWGQEASDDAVVHEVLHRWHESKQRIPEERWRKALEWMRKEGFVPMGFGKPTAAARS